MSTTKSRTSANGTLHNRVKAIETDYKMPDLGMDWPFEITYLPNGWGISIATIDRDLAMKMLECNADNNRNQRAIHKAKMLSDINTGKWCLTHQGIAFDRKGVLRDGQNRLASVTETGSTIESLVFFGVGGVKEMVAVDSGASRTAADSAKITGFGTCGFGHISTVRAFLDGPVILRKVMSHAATLDLLKKYRSMVDFVHEQNAGRAKKLYGAPVRAAVGRAFYHVGKTRLARFVAILCDLESATEPGDKSAVLLRGAQLNQPQHGSRSAKGELYRKAQRAISAFINKENITRLHGVEDDIYPLPTAQQIKDRE